MKRYYNILILIALPFLVATKGTGLEPNKISNLIEFKTETYCNARYSFCLDYPSDILDKKVVADNGDGIQLSSTTTEGITLNASGTFNVLNVDINTLHRMTVDNLDIAPENIEKGSQSMLDNQFEFIYQKGNAWFYQKTYLLNDSYIEINLSVPFNDRAALTRLIGAMKVELIL